MIKGSGKQVGVVLSPGTSRASESFGASRLTESGGICSRSLSMAFKTLAGCCCLGEPRSAYSFSGGRRGSSHELRW